MKFSLWLALALAAIPGNLSAVSEAYPRTAPGDIELKTLPAAAAIWSLTSFSGMTHGDEASGYGITGATMCSKCSSAPNRSASATAYC